MDAISIIKARRSVRSYTAEMPSKEQLDDIVYAAQHAPNTGAFSITVVTDKTLLDEMDEAVYQNMLKGTGFGKERASLPGYRPFYGAPALLVFSAKKKAPFSEVNTGNACTTGSLAASTLGLGSCFIMAPKVAYNLIDDLGDKLKLPEGYIPYCGLLVGYTDDPDKYYHKFVEQEPATFI